MENFLPSESNRVQAFLNSSPVLCRKILLECKLTDVDGSILISAPEKSRAAHALTLRGDHIKRAALLSGASHVLIAEGDEIWCSLPTQENINPIMQQIQPASTQLADPPNLIAVPTFHSLLELATELENFPGGATAVRFFDDASIACNNLVEATSGKRPNDWSKMAHRDYWNSDDLSLYKQRLLRDKRLTNYSYTAYLATGQKCLFTVDAFLSQFRGDLIRVVKVQSCVPV